MLTIQVLIEDSRFPVISLQRSALRSEAFSLRKPSASLELIAEHGLSFLIEKDGHSLIFDTGKSGAFVTNSKMLGLHLDKAEALVISHGHYDHGGGIRALIEEAQYRGSLWTGSGFFDAKWSEESLKPRFLGLDVNEAFLASNGITHHTLENSSLGSHREILPGIFIVGNFLRSHTEEIIAPRFTVERGGKRHADSFCDEICVVVDTPQGLVVVLGCAHPGIMNMLDTIQAVFGKSLYAVLGGSHLVEANEERIQKTGAYLKTCGAKFFALGHCTGTPALEQLAVNLPDLQSLSTGAAYMMPDIEKEAF